jgi:hypothetical protein
LLKSNLMVRSDDRAMFSKGWPALFWEFGSLDRNQPRRSSMSKLRNSAAEQVTVLTSAAALLKSPAQHFIDALTDACGAPHYTLTPQAAQRILNHAVAQGSSARRQTIRGE